MRIRQRMSQTQPDLGGARDESSSRPSGHGGVNTPGTHLVSSPYGASHTDPVRPGDPPGSVRDRSEQTIGERSPAWGDGHPVIILYRYWSGIYHFFDSFGNSGKRSGIGMVLVFDCFDCLGRGGRQPFTSKINENGIHKL